VHHQKPAPSYNGSNLKAKHHGASPTRGSSVLTIRHRLPNYATYENFYLAGNPTPSWCRTYGPSHCPWATILQALTICCLTLQLYTLRLLRAPMCDRGISIGFLAEGSRTTKWTGGVCQATAAQRSCFSYKGRGTSKDLAMCQQRRQQLKEDLHTVLTVGVACPVVSKDHGSDEI